MQYFHIETRGIALHFTITALAQVDMHINGHTDAFTPLKCLELFPNPNFSKITIANSFCCLMIYQLAIYNPSLSKLP